MTAHRAYTVTNAGRAPRAIFTREGMAQLAPGAVRTLFLTAEIADEERCVPGLTVMEAEPEAPAKAAPAKPSRKRRA